MTKTENYNLPQWEKTDRVLMEDFNAAMVRIDTEIAAGSRIVAGYYEGTGTASKTIVLGSKPYAVFFCTSQGAVYASGTCQGGLILRDRPLTTRPDVSPVTAAAEITDDGFRVYQYNDYLYPSNQLIYCNLDGEIYHYIAFL
ncbi:MAG TPA: hypothetical protein H9682_00635 [Firmicutes bacterium]|nr:hypothetical protein [Bacillota bacterium]